MLHSEGDSGPSNSSYSHTHGENVPSKSDHEMVGDEEREDSVQEDNNNDEGMMMDRVSN